MSVSREGTTRNCTLGSQCPPYSYRGTDLPNLNSHLNNKLLEDVVLHFQDSKAALDQRFRCSRDLLRRASPYFEVLLDPTKFNEGREVEHALQELLKDYPDITSIPIDKLPVVVIKDVGEIPAKDSHRMTALCLFIKILQDVKFGRIDEWIKGSVEPLTLVTLLAIIADRFEAKERVSKHVKRMDKKLFEDGKKDRGPGRKEINRRKRILTGMLLGLPDWARPSSASLICEGSEYWMQDNLAPNAQEIESNEEPLWCRLPGGMEEELQYRRECVLETIFSLPSHFVGLYTGKQLQCKLGYDSSPQCDSFQLGEMIRFLARKELLQLQSTYRPSHDYPLYIGNVVSIIETLRQCPSYQLDSNHRHCGLRTRLLPLLETLWPNGQVGMCLKCWDDNKNIESWLENPIGGVWVFSKSSTMRWETCLQHGQLKAMYTADERSWTPSPS